MFKIFGDSILDDRLVILLPAEPYPTFLIPNILSARRSSIFEMALLVESRAFFNTGISISFNVGSRSGFIHVAELRAKIGPWKE